MPNSSSKARFITDRDKRLFQFLFENKIATVQQIKRIIFSEASEQAVYCRLAKLVNSNWLRKEGHKGSRIPHYVFSITEKAYKGCIREEGVNDRRVQLSSEVPDHDLVLVDIRTRFEKTSSLKRFYPENILQSQHDLADSDQFKDLTLLRSDAAAEVVLQNKYPFIFPVEYEASLKAADRIEKKFLDYYVKYDGKAVLFICGDESIFNGLSKIEDKVSRDFKPKMYFAMLNDVLSDSGDLIFVSSNKEKNITL